MSASTRRRSDSVALPTAAMMPSVDPDLEPELGLRVPTTLLLSPTLSDGIDRSGDGRRCPYCGCSSFVVSQINNHENGAPQIQIQNPQIQIQIDEPRISSLFTEKVGVFGCFPNAGEPVASDGDAGWVPDTEEPFDLGLDVAFVLDAEDEREEAHILSPLPDKSVESGLVPLTGQPVACDGGASWVPDTEDPIDIGLDLAYVPDSEDEREPRGVDPVSPELESFLRILLPGYYTRPQAGRR